MTEKGDKLDSFDTVPPPASGDAYTAETVQRVVPPELLAQAKMELLKRPRPAPKPAAPVASPLAAPALPRIERLIQDDDDSPSDDVETLMRPKSLEISPPAPAQRLPAQVADSAPTLAPTSQAAADLPTTHAQRIWNGWLSSVLIFVGSMLLVLLLGMLMMRFLGQAP